MLKNKTFCPKSLSFFSANVEFAKNVTMTKINLDSFNLQFCFRIELIIVATWTFYAIIVEPCINSYERDNEQ